MRNKIFTVVFVTICVLLTVACGKSGGPIICFNPTDPSCPTPTPPSPKPNNSFVVGSPPPGAELQEGSVIEYSFSIYREGPGGIIAEIGLLRDDGVVGGVFGGATSGEYLAQLNVKLELMGGRYLFSRGHTIGLQLAVAEFNSAEEYGQCQDFSINRAGCTVAYATEKGAKIILYPFEGNWRVN